MSRLLVIDDEALIRDLMVEILESGGFEVDGVDDFDEALTMLKHREFDGVVSDIVMPGCSGLDLLVAIQSRRPSMPVILVTGAGTYENLSQALARGAAGLVTKPFTHAALLSAVTDALSRAERSERELRDRLLTPTLASALANAIEMRNPHLHGHCERLSAIAVRLAMRLGLTNTAIEAVRLGAILHDIGKIGIPDSVLLKERALDPGEVAVIQTHPVLGDELLAPLDLLEASRPAVRHHHERWDGSGYPDRLAGESIPLGARIVAVADSVEVMASRSLYREPRTQTQIVSELQAGAGSQWDPRVVALALELFDSGELTVTENAVVLLDVEACSPRARSIPVLLVEDDPHDALLARRAIEDAVVGASVAHASDIASATDLCRHSSWSLAVVDHHLPDGDGLDLLELMHGVDPALPIVVTTGAGFENQATEAFRRGASDYVVKANGYLDQLSTRVRALMRVG
jgi:putative two-component system response regulator